MALRALSFTPAPISVRSRSIIGVSARLYRHPVKRIAPSLLQRRFASEEVQTQSEPEADGATQAQHEENSIATSSQEPEAQELGEPTNEAVEESSALGEPSLGVGEPEQVEPSEPAEPTESGNRSHQSEPAISEQITEFVNSAKEKAGEYGQAATEAASGVASGGAHSAGLGQQQESRSPSRSSGNSAPPSNIVYIGNLFFDATDEDLRREFSKAGEVVSATVKKDARGLSRG